MALSGRKKRVPLLMLINLENGSPRVRAGTACVPATCTSSKKQAGIWSRDPVKRAPPFDEYRRAGGWGQALEGTAAPPMTPNLLQTQLEVLKSGGLGALG
jgi:hypothetical protein